MTLRDTFSANLRKIRKERNFTQEEFAELCNISTNYVGDIERQKNFPSVELIEKMAEVLAIQPYVLFFSEDAIEKEHIDNRQRELKQREKEKLTEDLIEAIKKVVEKQ